MTFCPTQYMPLSTAYLCIDCMSVGNCAERCPACASGALMGLAGVLNREEPVEKMQSGYGCTALVLAATVSLAA